MRESKEERELRKCIGKVRGEMSKSMGPKLGEESRIDRELVGGKLEGDIVEIIKTIIEYESLSEWFPGLPGVDAIMDRLWAVVSEYYIPAKAGAYGGSK